MDLNREKKKYNNYIIDKSNRDELDDYDINESVIIFTLNYLFPMRLNNIKLYIEVSADYTSEFLYLSCSIITNLEKNMKILKSIFKNFNNIEFYVIESIKDVVMQEIELNIY